MFMLPGGGRGLSEGPGRGLGGATRRSHGGVGEGKGLAHPARPRTGIIGKKVMIRASDDFLVNVADTNLLEYDSVASMDWPGITMYRGLVSARPHKQEMIEDLRRTAANGGMIMCIDRASEGQISHALLYEMDTIRKACASLEEGYLPPLTFVAVQIRDHTRLFPEVHGRHDITEKIGAHDCVEQDRNGVSTTGSTRQTSGVLEGQIKVEIVYPHLSVNRIVEKLETIQSAVSCALGRQNSLIRDCYYKCNGRTWHGNTVIGLSNICEGTRILVCPRLRGGFETGDAGSGASGSGLIKLKIKLSDQIEELQATNKWFEAVDVPESLRWPNKPSFVVMLGEDGRMILRLLLQCIERFHLSGYSFQRKFKEEDIFFTPLDGVLKIRKVVTMRKGLDAEGYQRDLKAIIPILDKHFRFKDAAGLPCFPMLVDDLITEIRMLNSEKTPDYFEDLNRRSIIFNHPATLCSSMRINIYTSILLHSSSLSGANYQNFRDALDPPNSYKFHPPNWVLRAYDRHDQSSPTGLGTVFNFPGKKYRNTFFSRLDFSRCLLTHGLINEITEKQVEAALYLLWPHQLPELHRKVMLLFKPTIRSTSANSVSPAVNTVNTIDILELFGSRK